MLTSFFDKSNPLNFIICGCLLLIASVVTVFKDHYTSLNLTLGSTFLGVYILLLFSILLLDFIIRKNTLSQSNSFGILVFTCLLASLPAILGSGTIVLSNVFLLLALRRIVSLTSERNIEKKIFDAALYISLATLFHFWSILFFTILYLSILKGSTQKIRFLFIPIVAILVIGILAITYHLLAHDSLDGLLEFSTIKSFDFSAYNSVKLLIPAAIVGTLIVWTFFIRILRSADVPKKFQSNYILITFVLLVSIVISVVSPVKDGSEMIFFAAPLAICTANYFERDGDIWFKEGILWLLVAMPVVLMAI